MAVAHNHDTESVPSLLRRLGAVPRVKAAIHVLTNYCNSISHEFFTILSIIDIEFMIVHVVIFSHLKSIFSIETSCFVWIGPN